MSKRRQRAIDHALESRAAAPEDAWKNLRSINFDTADEIRAMLTEGMKPQKIIEALAKKHVYITRHVVRSVKRGGYNRPATQQVHVQAEQTGV
jgi:hypothetical protein